MVVNPYILTIRRWGVGPMNLRSPWVSAVLRALAVGVLATLPLAFQVTAVEAVPLLEFTDVHWTGLQTGGLQSSFIFGALPEEDTFRYFSRGEIGTLNETRLSAVLSSTELRHPGPSSEISIKKLFPNNLLAETNTVAGTDKGTIQLVANGHYTLTEKADVTLTIFQHEITASAKSGNIVLPGFTSTGTATAFTSFDVAPFLTKEFTSPLGKTVTSSDGRPGTIGGPGIVGPSSQLKTLEAGSYGFNMTLFVGAESDGFAAALAALGSGVGFSLAAPEPATLLLLAPGMAGLMLACWRLRRPMY